jgi:hypothetical protein
VSLPNTYFMYAINKLQSNRLRTPILCMQLINYKVTEVFIKLMYFLLILDWSQLLVVIQEM